MTAAERGALTFWRRQREGLVKKRKERDRFRSTHFLGMAEGGTCQYAKRKQPSKEYSLSEESRGRDLSEHRN